MNRDSPVCVRSPCLFNELTTQNTWSARWVLSAAGFGIAGYLFFYSRLTSSDLSDLQPILLAGGTPDLRGGGKHHVLLLRLEGPEFCPAHAAFSDYSHRVSWHASLLSLRCGDILLCAAWFRSCPPSQAARGTPVGVGIDIGYYAYQRGDRQVNDDCRRPYHDSQLYAQGQPQRGGQPKNAQAAKMASTPQDRIRFPGHVDRRAMAPGTLRKRFARHWLHIAIVLRRHTRRAVRMRPLPTEEATGSLRNSEASSSEMLYSHGVATHDTASPCDCSCYHGKPGTWV